MSFDGLEFGLFVALLHMFITNLDSLSEDLILSDILE